MPNIVSYSTSAEHVGIIRSIEGGNMPHILGRISAHTRAVASILFCGAARHHACNPCNSIHLERLYGGPVLLSGVPALVLSKKELDVLDRHQRLMLCRLQKLNRNTPACVVYFLSGTLPISAIVHLRQLSLIGMIARLGKNSILREIGANILLSDDKRKSWFLQVRDLTLKYSLPDPLQILGSPPTKITWKKNVQS